MPHTTPYKKGDIILVPFPFSDKTFSKKRPAVVISSDVYNSQYFDIIIMAIKKKVSDLFHSGWHKSFAFINASLRILLPTAFDVVGCFCFTAILK